MLFACEGCTRIDYYLVYVFISCVLHVTVKESSNAELILCFFCYYMFLSFLFLFFFSAYILFIFFSFLFFWYCIDAQERVWSEWEGVPILMTRFDDSPSSSFCSLSIVIISLSHCLSSISLLYIRVLCMKLLHSGYVNKRINIIA